MPEGGCLSADDDDVLLLQASILTPVPDGGEADEAVFGTDKRPSEAMVPDTAPKGTWCTAWRRSVHFRGLVSALFNRRITFNDANSYNINSQARKQADRVRKIGQASASSDSAAARIGYLVAS